MNLLAIPLWPTDRSSGNKKNKYLCLLWHRKVTRWNAKNYTKNTFRPPSTDNTIQFGARQSMIRLAWGMSRKCFEYFMNFLLGCWLQATVAMMLFCFEFFADGPVDYTLTQQWTDGMGGESVYCNGVMWPKTIEWIDHQWVHTQQSPSKI